SERVNRDMHRSNYILTQLGGQTAGAASVEDLLREINPTSCEPGPQGFLQYVDQSSLKEMAALKQQQQLYNHQQQHYHMQQQQQQQQHHQQMMYHQQQSQLQSQQSQYIHNHTMSTTTTSTATSQQRMNGGSSGGTTSGGIFGFKSGSSNNNNNTVSGSVSGTGAGASRTNDDRKSSRASRLINNEDERRRRKEQKRARAKEKPIFVSKVDDLPPECIKMIKKSKIPDEQLREHFEILLPILRFRTGFNLRSANNSRKSVQIQPMAIVSPETSPTMSATTTTTTVTASSSMGPMRYDTTNSKNSVNNNVYNEDDSYDESRLEQSILPKGSVELFEKGDVKKLYKGLKQIGSGGFGSVFLAKSTLDKCEIAIKKIAHTTPKAKRTNLNEIGFLHFCNHPNIVKYFRSHLVDEQVWIAMEYMQGGTLTEACSNHTFNESCIAYVAKGMLEGLKYLHSHNLVHRDIKSGNIMMTIEGKIKIVDFGLCVDATQRKLTHMAGSPFWMSPEMIKGIEYGCVSDIWSFGICLLELANGQPPNRKSSLNAMFAIATYGCTGLDRPELWSDSFKHFLTLCLEVDPSKRHSAEQLLKHPWLQMSENPETMKKVLTQIFISNAMHQLEA
ncbi:hypothetical protein SAMD00019534_010990, partial [Acytostelium subglobosum LB1]|uniref:hypothetical protein n=1 Tax=Acytostelium subglobosum LB1 TaxID=1410327 RepID=UPI0006449BCF